MFFDPRIEATHQRHFREETARLHRKLELIQIAQAARRDRRQRFILNWARQIPRLRISVYIAEPTPTSPSVPAEAS